MKLATTEAKHQPICPHCEKEMPEVQWKKLEAINAEYVFMCPSCRKVLGFGIRSGGWGV